MPSPIAFIIGAGSNVGKSVAEMLLKNGYKVALGSRKLDQNVDKDGFLPVTVDVTKPETIASAFKTVEEKLGAPASVVVYNVGAFSPLPTPGDPLSLSTSNFEASTAVGNGVFNAAKHSVAGFRTLTQASPSTRPLFILTGNITPFVPPSAGWVTLQSQKIFGAYLVELFASIYAAEGIRFYFASQVSPSGGSAGKDFNGPAHGVAYERLLKLTEQAEWDQRFLADGSVYHKEK